MTNKKISILAFSALAALGTLVAAPRDAAADGVSLGLKTGYAIAMGDAAKNAPMSDGVKGQVPIWLDVGYNISALYVGGFFQYGIGFLADKACPSGASCSASDIRFGINARYHFMDGPFKPFAGLGIGYEMANFSASAGGAEVKGSYKGLEFLNIQLGGDYAVTPNISVGPFISFSLGQYSSASLTVGGTETSADIKDKAMHQWLFLGLGGTYNL